MHFYVKDWHSYHDLYKPELSLGSCEIGDEQIVIDDDQRILDILDGFDYEALDEEAQAAYDTLKFYVECSQVMSRYPQFNELFSPYSRTHFQRLRPF